MTGMAFNLWSAWLWRAWLWPAWAVIPVAVAHLALGASLGVLYFCGLWWNVRLFAGGGHAARAIAAMAGRFALLGGVLTATSLEGAMPLLTTAIGLFAARAVVVRRIRKDMP